MTRGPTVDPIAHVSWELGVRAKLVAVVEKNSTLANALVVLSSTNREIEVRILVRQNVNSHFPIKRTSATLSRRGALGQLSLQEPPRYLPHPPKTSK
uniref:Uncharacterized protein n=1 Tax=Timema genevievae TaxID=629358 RepID=A0A7R9JZW2_TIMGE|nr:unnamed protein product [Timema genevievae]